MKIKKSTKIFTVVLVVICAFLIIRNNFMKTDSNKILAMVNDEVIYISDLQAEAEKYGSDLSKNDKRLILQDLINKEILKVYAEKNNFFENPEIRENFNWQKSMAKTELLLKTMLEEKANQNVQISDRDCKAYINDHPLIKIMTVVIPIKDGNSTKAKKKIYKAYNKLKSGAKFENVRNKFVDKIYRGTNNEPEIVKSETLRRMFPNESIDLSIGEYTKPIASPYGYYIIKRYDDPEFEEIKKHIKNEVRSKKEGAFLTNYLDKIRSGITIYDKNLKEVLSENKPSTESDILIATYDDYKLKYNVVKKYLDNFLTKEQRNNMEFVNTKEIIKQIALQEFLNNVAIEEHSDTISTFISQLKAQEQEFESKWEDFVLGEIYKNVISQEIEVSDEEIQNYYQNNQDEFYQDGKLKSLPRMRNKINMKLKREKQDKWLEKVRQDYNIKIVKYEKYL
ncbi:MAG: peptidylprolyl isomerase [Candidatus Cloacimonadota bacterium]|nr:peptidylprolyl isomerase [Candidatus Cloacimonadota bacterium]